MRNSELGVALSESQISSPQVLILRAVCCLVMSTSQFIVSCENFKSYKPNQQTNENLLQMVDSEIGGENKMYFQIT
jgi:hypothetical protein